MRYYEQGKTKYIAVGSVLDLMLGDSTAWVDQAAMQTGEACHAAMAGCLTLEATIEEHAIKAGSPENVKRVLAVLEWLQPYKPEPVAIEQTMFSRLGFAGTPDWVGYLTDLDRRGRCLYVIDWKFAEKVELRYLIQLEAYGQGFYPKARRLIVRSDRAGKVHPQIITADPSNWAAFLATVHLATWRRNHGLKEAI